MWYHLSKFEEEKEQATKKKPKSHTKPHNTKKQEKKEKNPTISRNPQILKSPQKSQFSYTAAESNEESIGGFFSIYREAYWHQQENDNFLWKILLLSFVNLLHFPTWEEWLIKTGTHATHVKEPCIWTANHTNQTREETTKETSFFFKAAATWRRKMPNQLAKIKL